MAKSTPLRQIQDSRNGNSYINEQQMQMVTQAQQAAQAFQQPQDSSQLIDGAVDENAINELLQNITSETFAQAGDEPQMQSSIPQMQSSIPQMPTYFPSPFNQPHNYIDDVAEMPATNTKAGASGFMSMFSAGALNNDLKLAAICVTVFIIASHIPLEKLVYRYVSLDKIPYSQIVIKAILAGILFIILGRLI